MSCQDYNGLLNQIKTPFILGGDFNAHHSAIGSYKTDNDAMGSSKTDNDGNLLLKTIDNHQLVFLNDGSPTKLSRPNQCVSAIDVSLVSSSIAHYFDWEVVDDTYSSDHFPIKIVMGLRSSDIGTMFPRTRWKVEAGNLPLFTEYCNRFFPEDTQYLTAGKKLTLLFSFLTQAGDNCFKRKAPCILRRKPSPPWWDDSCTKVVQARRLFLKQYKNQPTFENYIKSQEAMAQKLWHTASDSLRKRKGKVGSISVVV
ncbi:Endonuclease-reverse transcriptase [Popillia japonica]|uniref:Endonuclease-reverse transcriptase n=1 Tax=Popillia japonica TaxID=7064 RepID=A0AAW1N197_POPJA